MFRANSTDEFIRYINSDWARLKDGRRSKGGYTFIFLGRLVSH